MTIPETIDLHMHSTVSDGTDTPEELCGLVRRAGIGLFSLTDHDDTRGCERLLEKRMKTPVSGAESEQPCLFITGAEFSSRDRLGKYHILGYGYDVHAPAMHTFSRRLHALRLKKVQARLDFLKERFGFVFSEEDLQELFARDNPGKPHIGNLMVQYGYAPTKEEAIHSYINQKKFRTEYISPEEAIGTILESGGIPILAHPAYGNGDQMILGKELRARILRLKEMGLAGVEGYYSGFLPAMSQEVIALAEEFGMYVTAGSDYHGRNKLVDIGDTGLAGVSLGTPGLVRFLETILPRAAEIL